MNRRAWLLAVTALLAAPSRAQRPYRIGIVMRADDADGRRFRAAFVAGMKEQGYVEVRDYVTAVRYYGGQRARIESLTEELIGWPVDVLIASVSSVAVEMKKRTSSVPIIMATAVDAVGEGLVASLARPGGNVTGMTSFGPSIYGKLIELARELLPQATRIAFMLNPRHSLSPAYEAAANDAAKVLTLELKRVPVSGADDLKSLSGQLRGLKVHGLVIATDGVLYTLRAPILRAASSARLPTVALLPELSEAGAVASYGFDLGKNYRALARFVDRIRKGARPGDLPVEQPTQFDLVLNRKAAQTLGVAIPPTLLARADRVIG